ncbi:MAG: hypothetical protein MZV70_17040 [Desulfobacterales bacterium]|nr:hypothetical protein [Desulfobacterales bacterium]
MWGKGHEAGEPPYHRGFQREGRRRKVSNFLSPIRPFSTRGWASASLILDADLGLSNIDVLFGIAPCLTLKDVLMGEKSIADILCTGPGGIMILPAGSGVRELTRLSDEQRLKLVSVLDDFDAPFDVFLIDTGAGILGQRALFLQLRPRRRPSWSRRSRRRSPMPTR